MYENPSENHIEKSPEGRRKKLDVMLAEIATNVNAELMEDFGVPFLDETGAIRDTAFEVGSGGPYDRVGKGNQRGIKDDRKLVRTKMVSFSGADEIKIREYHNAKDKDEYLGMWNEKRKVSRPELAEVATMAILHKVLGEKYFIMRSAAYDDYENGIDTIIFDKSSGEAICAFDEVLESGEGEKYDKKVARSKKKLAEDGGMNVKYGMSLNNETGKFERGSLNNLPAFCIPVESEDLESIIDDMNTDLTEMGEQERGMVGNMVRAIKSQKEIFEKDVQRYKSHIQSMDTLLSEIEKSA